MPLPPGDDRPSLTVFWIGTAVLAAIFVPPSLFGWDPANVDPGWMGGQLATGASLCVVGLIQFRRATVGNPRERKRGVRALASLVVVCVALIAAVFATYAYWWDEGRAFCDQGQRAPLLQQRRELLAEASPYRDRVAFFNEELTSCAWLQDELDALDRDGVCPPFVPLDVECSCGELAYPADASREGLVECSPYADDGNTREWTLRSLGDDAAGTR